MSKKRHTAEQIIGKLREAEILLSRGWSVPEACKKIEVSEQTYYRWRKEYGGLRLDQAKRLKELERENGRLKKLVADQALDNLRNLWRDGGQKKVSENKGEFKLQRVAI